MKRIGLLLLAAIIGAASSIAFVNAQPYKASFVIKFKAQGSVELECSEGCTWEELAWRCGDDPTQSCVVAIDESGMAPGRGD